MSKLVRSSLALMISSVATAGLGMLFWAVAAWTFDPATVGRASAGSSAMQLLGALGQLALTSVFARVLPTLNGGVARFVLSGYGLVVVVTLALTAGFFTVGLGDGLIAVQPLTVLAFGLAVGATAISVVQDGVLVALGRATWVPVKNTALAVARTALLPLLATTTTPEPILVAWALPTVAAVLVINVAVLGRGHTRTEAAAARPTRRDIMRLVSGQYAGSVVNALIYFFPPVLVTLVLGPEANAVFFIPWTVATALTGLLWNVVVPFVAESSADRQRIGDGIRTMVRTGTLITVGGGAALVLLGPTALWIAGSTYHDEGAPVLRVLGLALPFVAIVSYFDASQLVRLRSSRTLAFKILAGVLFLGGAVPAMHAAGVTGAAAAFLLSQAVVGLLLLRPVIAWYREHVPPAPGPRPLTVAEDAA